MAKGFEQQVAEQLAYLNRQVTKNTLSQKYLSSGLNLVAPYFDLPGLIGLWYAGNVQRSTGNIYDLSGQGRTLTYNGNPTINYLDNGIAYAACDGTGDYWSRSDETDLDVLGTESWAANPGLTLVIWVNIHTIDSSFHGIFGKWENTGNQRSYILDIINTNYFRTSVSNLGTSADALASIPATITDTWLFMAVRFTPSTELKLWVNSTTAADTTSVPASIFNSTAGFGIGSVNTLATHMDWSIAALCANAISDTKIQSLYQRGRVLFGV